MIDYANFSSESKRNSAIAVTTTVIKIYLFDSTSYIIIFPRRFKSFQVIVKCTPGYLSYLKQVL